MLIYTYDFSFLGLMERIEQRLNKGTGVGSVVLEKWTAQVF
jgi:hypothetical protein